MDELNPTNLDELERALEEAEREELKRREQERDDFKWLMQDPRGRRFVWGLMRESNVFHSTFNPDALAMAHNEGMRGVGLKVMTKLLEFCPEHWLTMIRDQTRR